MDALTSLIVKRGQLISSILDERNKAEQKGEKEKTTGLDQQLKLQIQNITAEIRLLRKKEQLPVSSQTALSEKEEGMPETQKGPVHRETRSLSEVPDNERKRIEEARGKEIGHLREKTGNIRKALEVRPGDMFLIARLEKLEDRRAQLQELNDKKIVTARTAPRHADFLRPRYFGLV